jgi:hypothetical protein
VKALTTASVVGKIMMMRLGAAGKQEREAEAGRRRGKRERLRRGWLIQRSWGSGSAGSCSNARAGNGKGPDSSHSI